METNLLQKLVELNIWDLIINIIKEYDYKMKNNKMISLLQLCIAWLLLIISIWGLGNITGNFIKAVMYGLIVGNAVVSSIVYAHERKKYNNEK